MGKVFDIEDKLSYAESPKLKIGDVEVQVNDDAQTMVKVMAKLGDRITPQDIVEIYELIIPEKDRKKIDKLKLNFADFQIVVKAAISAATGTDLDVNEEADEE